MLQYYILPRIVRTSLMLRLCGSIMTERIARIFCEHYGTTEKIFNIYHARRISQDSDGSNALQSVYTYIHTHIRIRRNRIYFYRTIDRFVQQIYK